MKDGIAGKDVRNFAVIMFVLFIIDFINLPSILGLNMFNINWDFCMGTLNVIVVILLYINTFKTLDARTIERDRNKNEISSLLLKECYNECLWYVDHLNKELVDKYVVPKIDFNCTDNTVIKNLQNSPFLNENTIMDFVKDGQVTREKLEGYLNIRKQFREYICMRIIAYDAPGHYKPLGIDLRNIIDNEIKNLKIL